MTTQTRLAVFPAIFFDMDGVLIDSEPVWQDAIGRVFGELGIMLDAAMQAHTAGMENAESVRWILSHHPKVKAGVPDICRRIDNAVLRRIGEGIGAIPGADALLRELAGCGMPLALVSTSSPALMAAVLRANRWDGFFRVVLSSEEVGPGKPDPAVYREAVQRMRVDAAQSVAIEDTLNGVRAAHGAGLRVIGFTRDVVLAGRMKGYVWRIAADYAGIRSSLSAQIRR